MFIDKLNIIGKFVCGYWIISGLYTLFKLYTALTFEPTKPTTKALLIPIYTTVTFNQYEAILIFSFILPFVIVLLYIFLTDHPEGD